MDSNQISNFLTIGLIVLVSVFFILLAILVVIIIKDKKQSTKTTTNNKTPQTDNKNVKQVLNIVKIPFLILWNLKKLRIT